MWLDRVPIRKQLAAIWMFCRGSTAEEVSESCKLDYQSSCLNIFRRWLDVIAFQQEKANYDVRVGGDGIECEADEVALRAVPGTDAEGNPGV